MVSNARGPTRALHLAGAAVRDLVVWAPCSGSIAVGITPTSYAGHARIGGAGDARVIGDPRRIVTALEEELAALRPYASAIHGHTGRS